MKEIIAEEAQNDAFEILKRYSEINPSGISNREEDNEVYSGQLFGDLKVGVPIFDLYLSVFPNSELPALNRYNTRTIRKMLVEKMAERVWTSKGKKTIDNMYSEYIKYFMLFLLFPNSDDLEKKILEYYKFGQMMAFFEDLTFEELSRWISSSYCVDEEMVELAYKLNLFKMPENDDSLVDDSIFDL